MFDRSFVDLSEGDLILSFDDYVRRFGQNPGLAPNLDHDDSNS